MNVRKGEWEREDVIMRVCEDECTCGRGGEIGRKREKI